MSASVVIGLSAVVVAIRDGEAVVLTVRPHDAVTDIASPLPGLPFGPFDPEGHRTFELGLRAFVTEQTRFQLGYVEQLYTFGDKGRDAPRAEVGAGAARVVSVGYLGLTPTATETQAPDTLWAPWSRFFPWEDWRHGRPALLDEANRKRFAQIPGGGMYELACHLVDTVVTLMGPPTSVQAFGNATRAPSDPFVDNQLAVLSYPKATVTIRCNHADPFGGPNRYITVRGTHGDMEIRPLESGEGILRLDQPRDTVKVCREVKGSMVMSAENRFKKGENAFELKVPKGRYDEEFRDLARVLRGQAFGWSADHDIAVHATALRAAGLTP